MKNKNQKLLLLGTVVFLILILPILIYLARTQQLFRPQAAFGQVTVNLVPLEVTKNVGEPFLVEVHANSGVIPVSGISVTLSGNLGNIVVQDVTGATATGEAFTDLIYDKQIDPYTFTLLSKKPTAQLPTGSFKIATLSIISYESGTHTLSVNTERSQAVGFNGTSEDVALTTVTGTQTSYTINDSLCHWAQCANITVQEELRPDNKYNIRVSWQQPSNQALIYKVYRNTDAAVPENNPDTFLAGISTTNSFVDTKFGDGFAGETNVHYNVDSYLICPLVGISPTPTQIQTTLTPITTPTLTPTATPAG